MINQKRLITFFKSGLWPRCLLVSRELKKLKIEYPQLEIEEIDVLLHPLTTLKNNIRMIPTLMIDRQILSGIFLSAKRIRNFTKDNL